MLKEEVLKKELDFLVNEIKYIPYDEIKESLDNEICLGKGSFGFVYKIDYNGKCAAKQITINVGQVDLLLKMALDELKIMIKKKDSENIIKIIGYSYKTNKDKNVSRFYIIMDLYKTSLN